MTVTALERATDDHTRIWLHLAEEVGTVHRTRGAVHTDLGVPVPFFNVVLSTDVDSDDLEGVVSEVKAIYEASGVPWMWLDRPGNRPADLAQRLPSLGFTATGEMPVMACDLGAFDFAAFTSHGLDIAPARDEAALEDFLAVLGASFGMPADALTMFAKAMVAIGLGEDSPLQNFVGRIDGRPVGSASVYFGAPGVAGVYDIGAIADVRKRGIGAAMTAAVMAEGIERGCDLATLQSSADGYPVYARMGYAEVGRYPMFSPAA